MKTHSFNDLWTSRVYIYIYLYRVITASFTTSGVIFKVGSKNLIFVKGTCFSPSLPMGFPVLRQDPKHSNGISPCSNRKCRNTSSKGPFFH